MTSNCLPNRIKTHINCPTIGTWALVSLSPLSLLLLSAESGAGNFSFSRFISFNGISLCVYLFALPIAARSQRLSRAALIAPNRYNMCTTFPLNGPITSASNFTVCIASHCHRHQRHLETHFFPLLRSFGVPASCPPPPLRNVSSMWIFVINHAAQIKIHTHRARPNKSSAVRRAISTTRPFPVGQRPARWKTKVRSGPMRMRSAPAALGTCSPSSQQATRTHAALLLLQKSTNRWRFPNLAPSPEGYKFAERIRMDGARSLSGKSARTRSAASVSP